MRIYTYLITASLLIIGYNTTIFAQTYEVTFDTLNSSGWFGGDDREGFERNVAVAQSVTIEETINLETFSFYFTNDFDYAANPTGSGHEVMLRLHVRDSIGTILQTNDAVVPDTFNGGWVTWSDINLDINQPGKYIFSTYLVGGYDSIKVNSGQGCDGNAGYLYGERYAKYVTSDSSADVWGDWSPHSWDSDFKLTGNIITTSDGNGISQRDSLALVDLYNSTNGVDWNDNTNWLIGPVSSWYGITVLDTNVTEIILYSNGLSGSIPSTIGNLTELKQLYFNGNALTGSIPESLGNLTNLTQLRLYRNELEGVVPETLTNLTNLVQIWFSENNFTSIPDFSSISTLNELDVEENALTFEDLEPNIGIPVFKYSLQDEVGSSLDTTLTIDDNITLEVIVGGSVNAYQWMKDDKDIPGATDSTYTITSFAEADSGVYKCRITNSIVPDLTLYTAPVSVNKTISTDVYNTKESLPNEFSLFQNYPNPFNPTTKIQYSIPVVGTQRAVSVRLKVYDVLGNEIATLVNEEKSAGSYEVEFDATSLPSGVYFYTINAGSFTQTKKMLLLK